MTEYKLGKVYTFLDRDEAKEFVGKRGVFSNNYGVINDNEYPIEVKMLGILKEVNYDSDAQPFKEKDSFNFQFFRPILEEKPERMTYSELSEWLARGNGFFAYEYITSDEHSWAVNLCSIAEKVFDEELPECYRIRHFGTDECLIPTKEIFLKDCRGGKSDDRT